MNRIFLLRAGWIASLCVCFAFAVYSIGRAQSTAAQKEGTVHRSARGSFEVKLAPQKPEDTMADSGIGRFLSDKQFHGDIEAASKGQMLAFGNPAKGSAGYVAIEHVTGTLAGQAGSFALQHSGTMDHGASNLSVTVVPGSGTGQLAGLSGSMSILDEGGKHSFTFDYTLPAVP